MKPIPWRYVNSWNCIACGLCCREYDVVLKYPEWVKIIQTYGIGATRPGINRFYLGKRANGSCIFLYKFSDRWLCGLQYMKPRDVNSGRSKSTITRDMVEQARRPTSIWTRNSSST